MGGGTCTFCGGTDCVRGRVMDHLTAYVTDEAYWIPGPTERRLTGGAKTKDKPRVRIEAFRCSTCGHLDLFAP